MSIKEHIINFLRDKGFVAGGTIEDFIRATDRKKASNASRRLRELFNEGKIEHEYRRIEGVPNKVVFYRLKQVEKPFWEKPVFQKQEEVKSLFT